MPSRTDDPPQASTAKTAKTEATLLNLVGEVKELVGSAHKMERRLDDLLAGLHEVRDQLFKDHRHRHRHSADGDMHQDQNVDPNSLSSAGASAAPVASASSTASTTSTASTASAASAASTPLSSSPSSTSSSPSASSRPDTPRPTARSNEPLSPFARSSGSSGGGSPSGSPAGAGADRLQRMVVAWRKQSGAAVKIQSAVRGSMARAWLGMLTSIQSRRKLRDVIKRRRRHQRQRMSFAVFETKAALIQGAARGWIVRSSLKRMHAAAVPIQARWRSVAACSAGTPLSYILGQLVAARRQARSTAAEAKEQHTCMEAAVEKFKCPITQELPKEPVLCTVDGHVYEGKAIVKWVRENSSSPWNRQPVRMDQLLSFGEPFVRRSGLSFRPGQVSYMAMHLAIVGKAVQVRWSSGWREGVVDQYDSILQQHRVVYMDKEARGGGKRGDSYWYYMTNFRTFGEAGRLTVDCIKNGTRLHDAIIEI